VSAPLLYESHCHTPLCKHAIGLPSEYAAVAEQRGLKGLIVTCHAPLPDRLGIDHRMAPEEFDEYVDLVAQSRAEYAGRVDVRLGLESDYFPGIEAWAERLHARVPLHHVLGSVHMQVTHYKARYFTGDHFAYQKLYFEHVAESAETRLFDTLAHPDLVKNEAPDEWRYARIQPHRPNRRRDGAQHERTAQGAAGI
jgi:histidinol-phosphatase (PHP family)